ncbi:MAG: hypothetical protein ACR2NP_10355 [Pirellulaceae bacterium]
MFSTALNPVQSDVAALPQPLADGVLDPSRQIHAMSAPSHRITLNNGEVLINGTHADNTVHAWNYNSQTLRVDMVGIETRDFDISQVDSIRFLGRNGDDFYRNHTSMPSIAY